MNQFEKDLINNCFKRCYGLLDATKTAVERQDRLMLKACVESIAAHSGLRVKFVEENLTEILTI